MTYISWSSDFAYNHSFIDIAELQCHVRITIKIISVLAEPFHCGVAHVQ